MGDEVFTIQALHVRILSYLFNNNRHTLGSIMRAARVCRGWFRVCEEDELWERHFFHRWSSQVALFQ